MTGKPPKWGAVISFRTRCFGITKQKPQPRLTLPRAGALVEITLVLSGHTGSDHNRSNISIRFWHAQGHDAVSFGKNRAGAQPPSTRPQP
jgi:hypothetical protein